MIGIKIRHLLESSDNFTKRTRYELFNLNSKIVLTLDFFSRLLNNNHITKLQNGAFSGLHELRYL